MKAPTVIAKIQPRHVMSSRMKGHDAQEAARLAHAAIEDAIATATRLGREVVLEVWVREVTA